MFDRTLVRHIDNVGSDHSMVLINSNPLTKKRKKRFIFDKSWLKKEGLEQVISQAWEEEQTGSNMYKVHRKVANCRVALLRWKNNFQGNARKRIDNLKKLLEELKVCDCDDKKARNRDLRRQLKEAYDEGELFWSQK